MRSVQLEVHVITVFEEGELSGEVYGKLVDQQLVPLEDQGQGVGIDLGDEVRIQLLIDEIRLTRIVEVEGIDLHMGVEVEDGLAEISISLVVQSACVDEDGKGLVVIGEPAFFNDDLFDLEAGGIRSRPPKVLPFPGGNSRRIFYFIKKFPHLYSSLRRR